MLKLKATLTRTSLCIVIVIYDHQNQDGLFLSAFQSILTPTGWAIEGTTATSEHLF